MATFKRLTDLDNNPIWVNLDLVRVMYRVDEEDELPAHTHIGFNHHAGQDEDDEVFCEAVLETPHSIVG